VIGRVTNENPHVKLGAFHTLDIEANRDLKLIKEKWDSVALERVQEACVEGRGAEVGAIVCGEGNDSANACKDAFCSSITKGTAALCLLSEHMTVVRQRLEVPVPRKRMGSATLHDKVLLHVSIIYLKWFTLILPVGFGSLLRCSLSIATPTYTVHVSESNSPR
jgi:protein pelota